MNKKMYGSYIATIRGIYEQLDRNRKLMNDNWSGSMYNSLRPFPLRIYTELELLNITKFREAVGLIMM